ncbi:MAG: flagellar basal body P-ring biosynthesis protein FlgA [Chloroflexi bacterium ADurb.Bin360]|nr:MAG: flagellar basal body P-ring biosynthesis protein FlgA [Chloroflexi bacterium ADurb.Bin360]
MGRLRGFLWLIAGLVVAIAAGVVAYIALSEAVATRPLRDQVTDPRTNVVVTTHVIEPRQLLTAEDLEFKEVPLALIPEGAVLEVDEAVGKIALTMLYPGEVILSQRLLDPNVVSGDGRMAVVLSEDEFLMAFPIVDLMSRIDVLKPGDRVDLLFSLDFPMEEGVAAQLPGAPVSAPGVVEEEAPVEQQVTFDLLQNVTIAAVVYEKSTDNRTTPAPQALLFTVSPQDALVLKYVVDAEGVVSVVLRAPTAEGLLKTEPVNMDYLINYYLIPVGER